jgi:hypothetical protein
MSKRFLKEEDQASTGHQRFQDQLGNNFAQFKTYMTPRDEGLSGQAKNRIDGK